eukprot:ANDGO_08296.mRNA.1 Potassium voltage-gated channel protein shk-1
MNQPLLEAQPVEQRVLVRHRTASLLAKLRKSVVLRYDGQEKNRLSAVAVDRKLRYLNVIITFFATLGILLMISFVELDWNSDQQEYVLSPTGLFLKVVNVVVAWICAVLLFYYYAFRSQIQQTQWSFGSRLQAIWHSSLRWKFLMELLAVLIVPIPFTTMDDPFQIECAGIMFARLYLWVRAVRDFSTIYVLRHLIRASNDFFRRFRPKIGIRRSFKVLFYERTIFVSIVFLCFSLLISAFIIYTAERGEPHTNFDSYITAIWYTWAAASSTGYGDVVPTTTYGRIIGILQGALGIVTIAVLGGVITNKLSPTRNDNYAMHFVKARSVRKKQGYWAAVLIQTIWRTKTKRISPAAAAALIKTARKQLKRVKLFNTLHGKGETAAFGAHANDDSCSSEEILDAVVMIQKSITALKKEVRELRSVVATKSAGSSVAI